MTNDEEYWADDDYLSIINGIMMAGTEQEDRTDVGLSKQVFGESLQFNTMNMFAPFIQCRTFSPRIAFYEWKWMMNGWTDSKYLTEKGITIWEGNTSREFLDSRTLPDLPVGDVGKSYGYQFRNFGGVDQIEQVFNSLKNDPTSRRHVVSIWNPAELDDAPLAPCAFLYEFMVEGNKLHLHQHMRSADMVFGVPYNMAFSTFWLFSFARALGYEAGTYWWTGTNCHVYKNQYEIAETMIAGNYLKNRIESLVTPTMSFRKELTSLDDILTLEWEDVIIENWKRGPKIGDAKMAK